MLKKLIKINILILDMVLGLILVHFEWDFEWGKNVVIFGVNYSSSVLTDNKKKKILVFGEGQTQQLDDTSISTETRYSINFPRSQRKFCLSHHYNGSNSFSCVHAAEIYQFEAKDFKIKKPYTLCLENISKDFQLIIWKKLD